MTSIETTGRTPVPMQYGRAGTGTAVTMPYGRVGTGTAVTMPYGRVGTTGTSGQADAPVKPSRIPVAVYAEDLILHTGIVHQLRQRPEVELLADDEADRATVSLMVVDRLTEAVAEVLRRLHVGRSTRTGLVVGHFESGGLQTVIECGVAAVLRRAEADQDRLVQLVVALANGEGVLPGDLLGKLLDHVGSLQRTMLGPRGLTLSTLTAREAEMLRLVAEGFDTGEIAAKTSYSERTVKNVLHEITTRLGLRNRAHAVGYALRNGLI